MCCDMLCLGLCNVGWSVMIMIKKLMLMMNQILHSPLIMMVRVMMKMMMELDVDD